MKLKRPTGPGTWRSDLSFRMFSLGILGVIKTKVG